MLDSAQPSPAFLCELSRNRARYSDHFAEVNLDQPFFSVRAGHAGMDAQAFQGARVLVTGASSGIGFDIAARMHACGAHVTLLARNVVSLQAAAHRIEPALGAAADSLAHGSADADAGSTAATARVGTVVADLRNHARLADAVGEAVAAMGGLSVLVVSGGNGGAEYLGLDPALPASYDAVNQLHVQATLVLMRVRSSVRLRRARPVRGGAQDRACKCDL